MEASPGRRALRVAIAVHGTRGDVEPAAAVAIELLRRGHEVRFAAPPDLLGFAASAGLAPVAPYGPDAGGQMESALVQGWYSPRDPRTVLREARAILVEGWAEMGETLAGLADGVDLIVTGTTHLEIAATVAEAARIPLATLHHFPARPNTRILPVPLPLPVARAGWVGVEWLHWRLLKPAEDAQRRSLGLPPARGRATRRIIDAGTLEIQAYDPVIWPGLDAEWRGTRPIVGGLRLGVAGDNGPALDAWLAAGVPPVCVAFGSHPLRDPGATIRAIVAACRRLGARVLLVGRLPDRAGLLPGDDLLAVPSVDYAAVLPRCRAFVHHGGAGTTMAGLRAGIPALVLWSLADAPLWAASVKRLGVGVGRRVSRSTPATLLADLRTVLGEACAARARELAPRMIPP
ncbi:MAG: glycosyltransferase, partial [Chloroflexota bacterium]